MSVLKLTNEQQSKIKAGLAEKADYITNAEPAVALSTIKAILLDSGVPSNTIDSTICESKEGKMSIKSLAMKLYEKFKKDKEEKDKQEEQDENQDDNSNENKDEDDKDKNKDKPRRNFSVTLRLTPEQNEYVKKLAKEGGQAGARRWLLSEFEKQMKQQGLSDAEIHSPVTSVSLSNKSGQKANFRAGAGKTFLDLAVDSHIAKLFNKSKSEVMAESKAETARREESEDSLGRSTPETSSPSNTETKVENGEDSLQVVDEILAGFMNTGEISEADSALLNKLTGMGLEDLIPPNMMPPSFAKNDDD